MTREIKFRAWDKKTKSMILEVWEIGFGDRNNPEIWLVGDDRHTDNFELMQFTGLKDKDGKKIFEGDIVEHMPRFKTRYEIKYLTSGFYICPIEKDYGENLATLFAGYEEKTNICRSLEIIGNIYEHKHLLD
jgi:uncharacterized phage protein (TIGR01671 family)